MSWYNTGFYFFSKGPVVRKLTPLKIALRTALAIIALLIVVVCCLFLFKERLIYYPVKGLTLSIAQTGWDFEEVWLTGSSGAKVNSWYLPRGPKAVLLLHGNGGNLEEMIGRIINYHKLNYTVLAIDYEGFGLSEGKPSEEALRVDARAAWDFLIARGFSTDDILIHGFSLGGAVAARLAYDTSHKGPLVLDSTFTSLKDVADVTYPLVKPISSVLLSGQYDTLSLLGDLKPSFLIFFHSPTDEIVPYAQGLKLYETYLGGPKVLVHLEGKHMDFPLNQFFYYDAIQTVLGPVQFDSLDAEDESQKASADEGKADEPDEPDNSDNVVPGPQEPFEQ
jgi:fermentation-respiration switch protein FrsA (DUF1100 family)